MLSPQPRSHRAPSRVKKVSPRQARYWASSWIFYAHSHDIYIQQGRGDISTCTRWYKGVNRDLPLRESTQWRPETFDHYNMGQPGWRIASSGGALCRTNRNTSVRGAPTPVPVSPRRWGDKIRNMSLAWCAALMRPPHRPPGWIRTNPTEPRQDYWGVGWSRASPPPTH